MRHQIALHPGEVALICRAVKVSDIDRVDGDVRTADNVVDGFHPVVFQLLCAVQTGGVDENRLAVETQITDADMRKVGRGVVRIGFDQSFEHAGLSAALFAKQGDMAKTGQL